jgi:hypothetical protein
MEKQNNFIPSWKEKGDDQFYWENDRWIKCSESTVDALYSKWVIDPRHFRYFDDEGYLVYGYQ